MGQLLDFVLHFGDRLREYLTALVTWSGPAFFAVLFLVVFCETGLVVTPFLPGDSLLFAAGSLVATCLTPGHLPLLIGVLIAAALLGDNVNYFIGRRIGPKVFQSERSWLLNKKHLLRAQEFYEKHGAKMLILARFVPIVRTFAPFVAGVGKMDYRKFLLYSVSGGVAWVLICTLAGYWFGRLEWVQKNIDAVLVAIVAVSVLPMVIERFLAWRKQAADRKAPAAKEPGDGGITTGPAKTAVTAGKYTQIRNAG